MTNSGNGYLKENIIDLVLHNSGMFSAGLYISELEQMIVCRSEVEIRKAAKDLSDDYSWVKFSNDHIKISDKHKAKEKLKDLRKNSYGI